MLVCHTFRAYVCSLTRGANNLERRSDDPGCPSLTHGASGRSRALANALLATSFYYAHRLGSSVWIGFSIVAEARSVLTTTGSATVCARRPTLLHGAGKALQRRGVRLAAGTPPSTTARHLSVKMTWFRTSCAPRADLQAPKHVPRLDRRASRTSGSQACGRAQAYDAVRLDWVRGRVDR